MNAKRPQILVAEDDLEDRLDLLVENELDETRRARLLQQLAANPEGWEKCARAFLGSQVWEDALRRSAKGPPASVPVRSDPRWPVRMAAAAVAMLVTVASFFAGQYSANRASGADVAKAGPAPPRIVTRETLVPLLFPAVSSEPPFSRRIDGDGATYYTTRRELPPFVLTALQRAGHQVERYRHKVLLRHGDKAALEVPVTETRIFEYRPL